MWFSLEGFRALGGSNHPKATGGRLGGILLGSEGALPASPGGQTPLLAGSGRGSRAQPPGRGEEDLRHGETGEPQRRP